MKTLLKHEMKKRQFLKNVNLRTTYCLKVQCYKVLPTNVGLSLSEHQLLILPKCHLKCNSVSKQWLTSKEL